MPQLEGKDAYAEAGQLLRHYLRWREKLLGGYVAIVAALAVGVTKYSGTHRAIRPGLAGVGLLLTLVFWQLDRRNRELFDRCIDAGAALEEQAKIEGPFTAIRTKSKTFSHRQVLDCFFGTAAVGMLMLVGFLWWWQYTP